MVSKLFGQRSGDFFVVVQENRKVEFPAQGGGGWASYVLQQKLTHAGVRYVGQQLAFHIGPGGTSGEINGQQGVEDFLVVGRIGPWGHVHADQGGCAFRIGASKPLGGFPPHGMPQEVCFDQVVSVQIEAKILRHRRVGMFGVPRALAVVAQVQGVDGVLGRPVPGQGGPVVPHAKEAVQHHQRRTVGSVNCRMQFNSGGHGRRFERCSPSPSTGRPQSGRAQC